MKLFRISHLFCIGLAVLFGVLLFWTSQSVQQKEEQLAQLKENVSQEDEALRVLSVEWDYLNRPQRLEKLAVEQLGMQLPDGKEVVKTAAEIPVPVYGQTPAELASLTTGKSKNLPKKDAVVTPAKTEKQSFDKLIESLDDDAAVPVEDAQ